MNWKIKKSLRGFCVAICSVLIMQAVNAQTVPGKYHKPSEVNDRLSEINKANRANTKLHKLATSPGGRDLLMLEIGPETGSEKKTQPAIFVVGNLEGIIPISTEASLYLADLVLSGDAAKNKTWYILPNGNPDAAAHYFKNVLTLDSRNDLPHNDDMDESTDEDGWEDLNKDGLITQMRVKDPTGTWIPIEGEKRLMKRADASKGEIGMYKLYSEGTDNDGDGEYNEDSFGGVNVNRNFPHLFKDFTETGGAWPGSTPEVYSILEFVFAHPEIAMTFSFGETNFSMVAPKGGRQGSSDLSKIEIPESFAEQLGADPNKTYTIDEVIELVKPLAPPGFEITEAVVSSFLGLGAVVNPVAADLKFYNELADQYKEYLKEKGLSTERLDPAAAKDGSFELWAYYHVGVPSFSMDLWTLPKFKEEKKEEGSGLSAEKIKDMSNDDFVALGEEKIGAFLKEIGAPAQLSATTVINMVKGGQVDTKRIASMLEQMPSKPAKGSDGASAEDKALISFVDNELDGEGFASWTKFNHPTLGEVEIGGAAPYVKNTPPTRMLDSLLTVQVPWVITLSEKIPKLKILKTEVKSRGGNVYEVTAWVQNESLLPFPTAMGEKNQQPRPAILTLEANGIEMLSGLKRTPVNSVSGFKTKKYTWLIRSPKTDSINLKLESTNAWGDTSQVKLGGSK